MKLKAYFLTILFFVLPLIPILKEKEIYLTFDDGPISPYTMEIAKELEREGLRGTFFLVGKKVMEHGRFTKELSQRGHTIGNHTFNHNRFNKESIEESLEDLLNGEIAIAEKIGHFTWIYRPPGGGISRNKLEIFDSLGFKAIFWDVNTRDFENRSSLYIITKTVLMSWDGSIVLMHSCPSASKSLPILIKTLKLLNFKIKPIPPQRIESKTPPLSEFVKIKEKQKALLRLIGMESFIKNDLFLVKEALSRLRDYKNLYIPLSRVRALERKAEDPEEKAFWQKERIKAETLLKQSILRRKLLEHLIANILSLPEKAD